MVSSCHEAKYYKTALCFCGSVRASDSFACIGAGTALGGNTETRTFDAISIQSVQKRGLFHVIPQVLFRQGRDVVVL